MPYKFKNMNFSRDSLHIGDVDNLFFDEDFNGHALPSECMGA